MRLTLARTLHRSRHMMTTFRRRTERIASAVPVTWKHRGQTVSAIAADINQHGMFVRTDVPVEPGQLLQLTLLLPEGPLEAFVTVRFVGHTQQGRGFGAELFLMVDEARDRWTKYYRSRLVSRLAENESAAAIEIDELNV